MRLFRELGVFLRAKHDLGQAFSIPQVDENHAAVIARDMEPTGKRRLLAAENVDVDFVLVFDGGCQFRARGRALTQEFPENDVAHRETERWHRDGAVTELTDQLVVASAARNRA